MVLALSVVLVAGWSGTAAAAKYPDSIAAVGDSITTAFGTGATPIADAPDNSWASGSSSKVKSHYLRILAKNPKIAGRQQNLAGTGADIADLKMQMRRAAAGGAEYVTVLMGANDACARNVASMTSAKKFRTRFLQALTAFFDRAPRARVFVASIPDVNRLWKINKDNPQAGRIWRLFKICQSLLAKPASTAEADSERRKLVRKRVMAYNRKLADVCSRFPRCRFDGNAAFRFRFKPKHVSPFDFFHPSKVGQRQLAAVTWKKTFEFTQ